MRKRADAPHSRERSQSEGCRCESRRRREGSARHRAPASRRILLTRREAASVLGVSLSHFQRHLQPELPCVYSGQLRLYRPADLERWAEREAR
jgi:hypothetical protein